MKLLGLAAEAEIERWKLQASRQGRRALWVGIGVVFAMAAFAMLHICIWMALFALVRPVWAALIVVVLDIIAAGIFLFMARDNSRGADEIAALALRNTALHAARDDLTVLNGVWTVVSLVRGARGKR